MNPEVRAAIIGALVGGVVAYVGIALQARLDRSRRRKAVATALLCELYVVQDLARLVRDHESPANLSAHVPTTASDHFLNHADLFEPDTVAAVMEVVRQAADLQRELSVLEHHSPEHQRHEFLRRYSDVVLGDIAAVRPLLIAAGGKSPSTSPSGLVRLAGVPFPRII